MPKTDDIATSAAELALVIGKLVRRLRSGSSFPISQAAVLGRLNRDGSQTPSALAHAERVRPQSMAQIVMELEGEDMVSRRSDPTDKRQILIELTPTGRAKLDELRDAREGWLHDAIARELNPAERRLLLETLPVLRRLAES